MEIVLIISGSLVLMTFFAAGFDFLTKRGNKIDEETKIKVIELEKKVTILESIIDERSNKILQIENDVSFVTKLIEKQN
jgi:hypothetical protein